jgi:hypothetical protein
MKKRISTEDIINECKSLYKEKGIGSLVYRNMPKKLYHRLYSNGIRLSDVISQLGLKNEFEKFKKNEARWSWDKIIDVVKPIVVNQNFLPPAAWFQSNEYAYIVAALYSLGHTWDDLRKEFNSYENSNFVISRNGIRWRSHPEASLSNFLFSRGIEHQKGKKYPDEYSKTTGQAYGIYDLEFIDKKGNTIVVEVWGDKPNGHAEEHYEYKKKLKLSFNAKNTNFLGIHFTDCYSEIKLEKILSKYIGVIKPYNFQKNYDNIIPTSHWSNADEVILYCQELAKTFPNGVFPPEDWLRKRGKWKNRKGEGYSTLATKITDWIGGIRKLRSIINQPMNSTIKWDKETAIQEYKKVYEVYGLTTGQLRGKLRRNQITLTEDERFNINNLDAAVRKHFGTCHDLNDLLGIKNYQPRN